MRPRFFQSAGLLLGFLLLSGGWAGCGPEPGARLGVRLVRASDPLGDRASGFDRSRVSRVLCQIALQDGTVLASAEAVLDVTTAPGEQQLTLGEVPPGDACFARVLGLGLDGTVAECGATGPFPLRAGQRLVVTIEIGAPPAGDASCARLCAADAECPEGALCPSPCARGEPAAMCLRALCAPIRIGAPCAGSDDCAGLTCLGEAEGYPGGYCTLACDPAEGCPGGHPCKAPGLCLQECASAAECRSGYTCAAVVGAAMGCLPE